MHTPLVPHIEPEEVFLPLSPLRYAEFYSIEMGNFSKDILFYLNNISNGSKVLELGCGTGRICKNLSKHGHTTTGIDLSPEMLEIARNIDKSGTHYICMDMCHIAFSQKFDHIIIPYNTLNLLKSKSQILACFKNVYEFLQPGGTLLFQVHLPEKNQLEKETKKLFQFQMFSLPGNRGKLIKESIRSFNSEKDTFLLEERYRVRPTSHDSRKEDLHHIFELAGFSLEKWIGLLTQSQFSVTSLYGDYDNGPFNKTNDSLLLIVASTKDIQTKTNK